MAKLLSLVIITICLVVESKLVGGEESKPDPKMIIEKIVTGGQTGADQAALFVATELGYSVGGWCPLGGLDENTQSILGKYPLKEVTGLPFEDSVAERTKRNIQDSDATLIIVPAIPLPANITDGTLLTIKHAEEKQKPYLLMKSSDKNVRESFLAWIQEHQVKVLNIAGPRESKWPGTYDQTCEILRYILK